MPFVLFHDRFPEIAERETRSIAVLEHDPALRLPVGEYGFLEMFCDEPACDCRRVFFYVVSSLHRDLEAIVAWGWETPEFYARWLRDDDPQMIAELMGPTLNLGSPQSELAPAILKAVGDVLLNDKAFVRRVKRHYQLFRETVDPSRKPKARRAGSKRRPGSR
jgi:hypothetical protein